MLFGNRACVGLTWSTVNRMPLLNSQLREQVNNAGMVVSPLWLGPGNSHGFILESNQVIFICLRSSKDYYKQPGGGVSMWEGSFGCEFLRGSMWTEGMVCGRRWVKWVLWGTGTASEHLLEGKSYK